jgi:cytochrome oxidase Cu insertion factor (SCO1/SenC/PrrC family)
LRLVRRSRVVLLFATLSILGVGIGAGLAAALRGDSKRSGGSATSNAAAVGGAKNAGSGSPARDGWPFHRRVPAVRLQSASGRWLSLRSLHGKVVVLAPSMTLCHEVCPLTTQAFITMRRRVDAAGLASRVAFVDATVDPWRDSPARLRAYARLTGADFLQLTGPLRRIRRFWNWFGIGFRKVPQGNPPDVDWWTHKAETFDVEHTDGLFLIDAEGYERTFFPGMADLHGRIEPALRKLLSRTGLGNLDHPGEAWTEPEVIADVGRLLGVDIGRA